jgi:hypothetical protein
LLLSAVLYLVLYKKKCHSYVNIPSPNFIILPVVCKEHYSPNA